MQKLSFNMWLLTTLFCLFSTGIVANEDQIKSSINRAFPGIELGSIEESAVKGLYEVFVGPQLFYVSGDGRYLVQGKMIDLNKKKDLTEPKIAQARVKALDRVGTDNMVVFKPKKSKHVVSIFTDIDCGYCRKLHSEIDQYLEKGITVQYLFFPRAGTGSSSFKKAVSVWCADDRNEALTLAKQGKIIEDKTCDNPVSKHLALGVALGAKGTPMIISEYGDVLPGYVSAEKLTQFLGTK